MLSALRTLQLETSGMPGYSPQSNLREGEQAAPTAVIVVVPFEWPDTNGIKAN